MALPRNMRYLQSVCRVKNVARSPGLLHHQCQHSASLTRARSRSLSTSPSVHSGISLAFRDDIAVIQMDNKQNVIDINFLEQLTSTLDEVEKNESCRALITTGTGKFFCNGLDPKFILQNANDPSPRLFQFLNETFYRYLMFPIPTMAVMNGHAFAGGALLGVVHDLRTMNSDSGWICMSEVFLSIKFSEFMGRFLQAKLGGGRAYADATVLGKKYAADEALKDGLVHAVYPTESLLEDSIGYLNEVIPKPIPRAGVSSIKEVVYKDAVDSFKSIEEQCKPYTFQMLAEKVKNLKT